MDGYTYTLNIGVPQICVLSPLMFFIYIQKCVTTSSSSSIIKFIDDNLFLVSGSWVLGNNLALNVSKTKVMVPDFRKQQAGNYTLYRDMGLLWKAGPTSKYLGVQITEDLFPIIPQSQHNQEGKAMALSPQATLEIHGLCSHSKGILYLP